MGICRSLTDNSGPIEGLLDWDDSLLGEVYRSRRDGISPEEIRDARGADRTRFVWNYERGIRAVLDGDLPTSSSVAVGVARIFRRLLRQDMTPATEETLEANLQIVEDRAASHTARAVEDEEAKIATEEAETTAPTGIYVYTLPHYWHHPYDPDTGRTLLKVGRSDRDGVVRFRHQTRTTALPEDPILLRIYETGEDSFAVERRFHELQEAADHDRSEARTGGREWFLTSTKFLDMVAETLNLPTRHALDPEISD